MNFKTRITLGLTATALILGTAACGADAMEEFNDAPRSGNNDDPALTISFPDGFTNVARKCDGPNMVYASRIGDGGRAINVVANDPRCSDEELPG